MARFTLGNDQMRRAAASIHRKCCIACGRWGTQQFRVADQSDGHGEGWICENDRACKRRSGQERGSNPPP